MIRKLNKDIDDEYIRLAQLKARSLPNQRVNWFAMRLGIVSMARKVERVHSSTALVEFRSVVAKQQAIQCNLTGTNRYFEVKQVPEIRDLLWENAHVAQSFIDARKLWVNAALVGGLIVWSLVVAAIRRVKNFSHKIGLSDSSFLGRTLGTVIDSYLPPLIVETLVPFTAVAIRASCYWIRFKAMSEIDHFVVQWVSVLHSGFFSRSAYWYWLIAFETH